MESTRNINLSLRVFIHSKILLIIILVLLFAYILFICINLYKYYSDDFVVIAIPLFLCFYAFANANSLGHHIMPIFLIYFVKIFKNIKYNYLLFYLLNIILMKPLLEDIFPNRIRIFVVLIYILIVPLVLLYKNKKNSLKTEVRYLKT
jgi:hypothetical protein